MAKLRISSYGETAERTENGVRREGIMTFFELAIRDGRVTEVKFFAMKKYFDNPAFYLSVTRI
jgi:hypothetical protein